MAESAIPIEIGADEFERWLTPMQAYELLHDQWTYQVICSTLRRLLGHGVLLARAGILKIRPATDQPNRTLRCALVVENLWEDSPPPDSSDFWENGLIDFEDGVGYSAVEYACIDVRFEPTTIRSLIKRPASVLSVEASAQAMPPVAARGGAPRKGWWDDLWIEMIRRIRAGTLRPSSAADLQRIMADWLGEQGIYPGEDTLKKTALKLFKYLNE